MASISEALYIQYLYNTKRAKIETNFQILSTKSVQNGN